MSLFPDLEPAAPKLDSSEFTTEATTTEKGPLAYQLAPRTLDEYVGQTHVVGAGKPLRQWIEADRLSSFILWGPPGVGKTALARLVALSSKATFHMINAVMAKVQDIRDAIALADTNRQLGKRTILFVDEIHRFNKAQQDALLPDVEKGTLILIGATTENPYFSVNKAILSRCQLFELKPLTDADLDVLIARALRHEALAGLSPLDIEVAKLFKRQCHGDARKLINILESASVLAQSGPVTLERVSSLFENAGTGYNDDDHYDIVSAFIKSVRGSDADASLYWLARMIKGGEDPRFIARRLLILASEDIGNADPQALPMAVSALQTVQYIGFPEAKYTLSQVTLYLALAPKSNAATTAIAKALSYVENGGIHPVPNHLKDSHYSGAADLGHGEGYKYPHDYPGNIVTQKYWHGCSGQFTT